MDDFRKIICSKLHETYAIQAFDSHDVWAGNLSVELDGLRFGSALARAFLGEDRSHVEARVRAELYLRDVDLSRIRGGDIDAHLWTDINDHGFVDERGVHHNALGRHLPMRMVVDDVGRPIPSGNNLSFESDVIWIEHTGVYSYTVEFSADSKPSFDPSKAWISVNDISLNRDGVIVISPDDVRRCPSVTEVCVRKVGAAVEAGSFTSGTFRHVTRELETIPTDVVYLLPFFETGLTDLHTGEDVRNGTLGSVYAVRDFFRIDPLLVTPLEQVNILDLVADGLIRDYDLVDLLDGRQQVRLKRVDHFNDFPTVDDLVEFIGRDRLTQIVCRAELRALTRRAHELGKRVIFDLVLMQTSRDNPLIEEHPEWYVMDEEGRPKIHQIAWLVYSDVALLDLPFNKPLQNYLSGVAPFWIRTCDLDGVRIDASQTVDRPFLKQIKNRINEAKPDAIVLGETLCALHEAADVPADMIYALLVDFHRDVDQAALLTEFPEQTSGSFAPRTVAIAYFENHDSPRATHIWRERFSGLLAERVDLGLKWKENAVDGDPGLVMALLKNLQASVIDATAGTALNVNLAYALEMGTAWGEEAQTDFTNPTLLHPDLAAQPPHGRMVGAYRVLHELKGGLSELWEGHIYFHRNEFGGGDPDDRVLAYTRYTSSSLLFAAHNLDSVRARCVTCRFDDFPDATWAQVDPEVVFDTYSFIVGEGTDGKVEVDDGGITVSVEPLQSLLIRFRCAQAERR